MSRFGYQLCQFLVRRLERVWQEGNREEKTDKNETEKGDSLVQRKVWARQSLLAQRFQIGREACQHLCRESATLLALDDLPEDLCIAQQESLEQWALQEGKRCMFEKPMQRGPRRVACNPLLDVFCHRNLFPEKERSEERSSRVPVQIERPFPDTGFPGDILDGDLVIAVVQDQGRGCIQNALCSSLTPLSGLHLPAFLPVLLPQTSPSFISDRRLLAKVPKRQEGDPG